MALTDKKEKILKWLHVTLRVALALIFVYSGLEKIARPYDFLGTIYDFDLVGEGVGRLLAVLLPWMELILAWALLTGQLSRGAALGCCILGVVFIFVQSSAVWRGLSIKCGCFGPDEEKMVGRATLLRTSLILLAALGAWGLSIRAERQRRS